MHLFCMKLPMGQKGRLHYSGEICFTEDASKVLKIQFSDAIASPSIYPCQPVDKQTNYLANIGNDLYILEITMSPDVEGKGRSHTYCIIPRHFKSYCYISKDWFVHSAKYPFIDANLFSNLQLHGVPKCVLSLNF